MAQPETANSQYISRSKLSADAEAFVPGRGRTSSGALSEAEQKELGSQELNQLPPYITSCYPFVQGDPGSVPTRQGLAGTSTSSSLPQNGPGRPPAPNYTGQRMPAPHAGGYNFPGTRPPGPHNFASRGIRGLVPRPGYPGRPIISGFSGAPVPGSITGGPAGSGAYPYPYHYGHHMMHHHPPGWMPPGGHFPGAEYGHQIPPGYGYPTGYLLEGVEWGSGEFSRGSDKKSKVYIKVPVRPGIRGYIRQGPAIRMVPWLSKEVNQMVSIGVQNESGMLPGMLPGKVKKPKTKTIILMDAAIQTDFSDEIANLTLAEKPNALYKTRRWPDEFDPDNSCTTTDSEEVDSDSGYSSPLHRRNQINNGTHPVGGMYPSQGMLAPDYRGQRIVTQHPVVNPVHLQSYPAYINGLPIGANMVSPPMTFQSFSAAAANNAPLGTINANRPAPILPNSGTASGGNSSAGERPLSRAGSRSNVASSRGSRASSAGSPRPSSNARTEPEDDDGETSTVKKKRRRNRRRKKKGAGTSDDIGALSDEPYDLRRAHSSSNVSRTSTEPAHTDYENNSGLRFEDEDEFPNLLAASSRERKASGHSILSYSDILKSTTSLSQENLLNSSQFHSSTSIPSDFEKSSSGAKESKNARKRRKRREMANRAADEELAEITLEQQVLRELSAKHTQQPPRPSSTGPSLTPFSSSEKAHLEPDSVADFPPLSRTPPPPSSGTTLLPAPSPSSNPTPSSAPSSFVQSQPKAPQPSGKKSKQPISLNFADMIDALEKQQEQEKNNEINSWQKNLHKPKSPVAPIVNLLDSTAPAKRGKERETPKPKKPSPLKKVILKEREEKKRMRLIDDPPLSPDSEEAASKMLSVPGMPLESDLSQDDGSKSSSAEAGVLTPMSAEMSPISQNSPISMSPLSPGGSPLSSGITSPIANGNGMLGERKPQIVMKIHSRRFREYCTQILDKDIDSCCTNLLQDLVRFQDRLYHKDPTKAKQKRRIVLGLREVTKHLRLRKIKVVIISPNLERIQSKGGLDEALNNIIQMCTEQAVPFVFALGRRALGRACAKLVPVSVVGVFNYEGSEENFHSLMDLTETARHAYTEMVQALNKEQEENPSKQSGAHPPYYAHMGHSRTPSACSAISFASSILSEPICENYPQSEPETDSRGYEIIREALIRDSAHDGMGKVQESVTVSGTVNNTEAMEKITIVESLDDIDEVREDSQHDLRRMKKDLRAESDGDDGDDEDEDDDDDDDNGSVNTHNDDDTEYDRDTVQELPHIDSIHSSVVDLSTEILSQHSTKTLDLNTEVLSTHSSKAPGETVAGFGASSAVACNSLVGGDQGGDSQNQLNPDSSVNNANNPSAHKMRPLDTERIKSWVAESQQHIERLSLHPGSDNFPNNAGPDQTNAPGKNTLNMDNYNKESKHHDRGLNLDVCDTIQHKS